MVNQQLLDYIKEQLAAGVAKEEIKKAVASQGWSEVDATKAFADTEGQQVSASVTPPVSSVPTVSQPSTTSEKLKNASTLLYEAWAHYKIRWSVFIRIQLIAFVAVVVPAVLVVVVGILLTPLPLSGLLFGLLLFGLMVGVFTVVIWSILAFYFAIKDEGEQIGAKEAFRRSKSKLFPFMWVSFISSWVVLGGFFLLLIPGILFAVWFSLALWVLLQENERGMNALLKSKEYVRGRFWGVTWRIVFLQLIYLLFWAVTNFAPFLVFWLIGMPSPAIDIAANVISTIFSLIFYVVWTPVSVFYVYLLYQDAKRVRGEFAFVPSTKQKVLYALLPIPGFILGFLLLSAIVLSMVAFFTNVPNLEKFNSATTLEECLSAAKELSEEFSSFAQEACQSRFIPTTSDGLISSSTDPLIQQMSVDVASSSAEASTSSLE